MCTNTYTSRGASFIALPGALHDTHTHTQVAVHWRFAYWWHTHTHVWLCCTTHFSFTFTGAFLLDACGVTRNLRTYFISVQRAFLVDSCIADCTVRHPGVEHPFSSCSFVISQFFFFKIPINEIGVAWGLKEHINISSAATTTAHSNGLILFLTNSVSVSRSVSYRIGKYQKNEVTLNR